MDSRIPEDFHITINWKEALKLSPFSSNYNRQIVFYDSQETLEDPEGGLQIVGSEVFDMTLFSAKRIENAWQTIERQGLSRTTAQGIQEFLRKLSGKKSLRLVQVDKSRDDSGELYFMYFVIKKK